MEEHTNVQILLGQWHTSKGMCSALIKTFSGYGIFNLAKVLGVKFMDKFEQVVDYQVTCHVLELIWIAVGICGSQNRNKKRNANGKPCCILLP